MAENRTAPARTTVEPPPLFGRGGPGGPRPMGAKVERPKNARVTVARLWGYLRQQRAALVVTGVIVVVNALLNMLGPYLLGRAIDGYIIPGDIAGLGRIALLMLGVYFAGSLLTWVQAWIMAGAAQRTVRDIRNDLFGTMQTLGLRFFDRRAHGDLMSRLTNDIENINLVLTDSVGQIIGGVLTMIGVAMLMFWVNPILAGVSIASTIIMTLALNRWIAGRTRDGFRRQQAALGALNGLIEETVGGQRVVLAYHREPTVVGQFDNANVEVRAAASRAQIFAGFVGPMMNFISNLSLAIIAGTGGYLALQGMATVGTIASFMNYARLFGRPINDIANLYNTIQGAIAGAERVFEIIDQEPEIDASDAQPLRRIVGDVVFDDVSFGYDPGVPVLRDIDLHAQPGQIVALVGPTGAGKTTIVNLLTRFYEIDSGRITIDGVDIRAIQKDDLRQQLGIVLQDTFLFAGSVMDNIRYGRLDATDEDVIGAARLANADQFIHRLPEGYQTHLSERGSNLSQGQRQLLAIARAMVAEPSILILDEATSSVDTRTEKNIQEAMLRLMAGRTSFVIAHRLSTIREADQILVIDAGRIVERGTHDQLLAHGGFYKRLYASQFRATTAPVGATTNGQPSTVGLAS
jgi:ATP-binding cassette, subfamily B, multidrug efflux pump